MLLEKNTLNPFHCNLWALKEKKEQVQHFGFAFFTPEFGEYWQFFLKWDLS